MKFKCYEILVVFLGLIIISCKKNTVPPTFPIVPSPNVDVYIGGYSVTSNNLAVATYWKNGIENKVLDSSNSSQASSIGLIDNDVYLGGTEFVSLSQATYWKNGKAVYLPGKNSTVNNMVINGTNIYFGGSIYSNSENPQVVYWKNGAIITVTDGSFQAGEGAITFNNDNVYVAGWYENSQKSPIASYWKNGFLNSLADSAIYSTANAIAINGSDIYVAGVIGVNISTATIWKNGISTSISSPGPNTFVNNMVISGGDVYVAGSLPININSNIVTDQAVYWKNGIETKLSYGVESGGFAVAVDGNDVYVVGSGEDNNDNQVPVCWKNGVAVQLSKYGKATCILIVKH